MRRAFPIPVARCNVCGGKLRLTAARERGHLAEFLIEYAACTYRLDLREASRDRAVRSRERLRRVAKEMARSIRDALGQTGAQTRVPRTRG